MMTADGGTTPASHEPARSHHALVLYQPDRRAFQVDEATLVFEQFAGRTASLRRRAAGVELLNRGEPQRRDAVVGLRGIPGVGDRLSRPPRQGMRLFVPFYVQRGGTLAHEGPVGVAPAAEELGKRERGQPPEAEDQVNAHISCLI